MTEYFLKRTLFDPKGTFGILTDVAGKKLCLTCELPWLDNQVGKSCIPVGTYQVVWHNSPDHPDTWELMNVPDRTGILIHNGNDENDSEGCILVGDTLGSVNGLPAVLNSGATLTKLRQALPSQFTLTIS